MRIGSIGANTWVFATIPNKWMNPEPHKRKHQNLKSATATLFMHLAPCDAKVGPERDSLSADAATCHAAKALAGTPHTPNNPSLLFLEGPPAPHQAGLMLLVSPWRVALTPWKDGYGYVSAWDRHGFSSSETVNPETLNLKI